jgi:protein ImuB
VVLDRPLPAVLTDGEGDGIGVGAGGVLGAAPARLSVSGGPWTAVTAWAGPWPVDEQWWSGRRRRRRARMQLVTETGAAYLLVREYGGWWVEGAYD